MLVRLVTCSYIQGFLLFILFHSITCDCIFPQNNLKNGRFVYITRKDADETTARELYVLRFKCDTGYQRIGPRFIQCKDGQWTDVVPTCARIRCSRPAVVENAQYELYAGVNDFPTIGSFVVYSCNVGFELNNKHASILECVLDPGANHARWDGEKPLCIVKKSCPDPGVSKHGSRKGDCCSSGDVLEYSCNEDYELVGSSRVTCLAGNWSARRPLCRPLGDHCEVPPSIPYGRMIGDKNGDFFGPYDVAQIMCEPGYKYNGPTELIRCDEEGQWEDEIGECIEVTCDAPQPPANGNIPELATAKLTKFPYGFELSYICDKGFRLIGGDSWRHCEENGWSGKTPRCETLSCPDPGVPENGDRTGDSFEVGAKVRFQCSRRRGFYLIGSFERFCKPNGQWTGELSRCDSYKNYCPNPGIPIKGYKNSTSYNMGDKVRFHCEPGHIQIGSEVRECLPNRTWSGFETRCHAPYDFDDIHQVRDDLNVQLAENAEKQKEDQNKLKEATRSSVNDGHVIDRPLDINYPGRLIIYFAFDVSGSVGQHNFHKSIEFAKAIVKRVRISENGARAGALTFGPQAENMFMPMSYRTTKEVLDGLDRIEYRRAAKTGAFPLHLIRQENIPLTTAVFGEHGIRSIVFIITDGKANLGGNSEVEAEELKKEGVIIYCIGIAGSFESESLYKIASRTKDASGEQHPNVYILQNYATLFWLVHELTNGAIDYSQCGLGLENIGIEKNSGRVIGGRTIREPWPWMAALFMPTSRDEPECGGSIINENFIMTAAHCMYTSRWRKRQAKDITVKLGLSDVKNETHVQESGVITMHIHPEYRVGPVYDYDIALLQLQSPIKYNPFVRPICLPPKELRADSPLYSPEEFGWVAGWGHTREVSKFSRGNEEMKTSQVLKEILLPIQSPRTCIQSLLDNNFARYFFSDRMFCAGEGKRGNDTCFGDSGGPFMQSQMNSEGYLYWTQVGIVSWGIGCGEENTYGYYSHVQRLRSWIDTTISEAVIEDYSQCGVRMDRSDIERNTQRILDGEEALKSWPWMAALYMPISRIFKFHCGGSIINENFILTAAHCLYKSSEKMKDAKDIIVKLGLKYIKNETYLQESKVIAIHNHPGYRFGPSNDNDIALLQLDKPITYSPFVRPICLPPLELPADSPLYVPGEYGSAIGLGDVPIDPSHDLSLGQALKEILVPIQSSERCIQSIVDIKYDPSFFTDRMFCAGDGKEGNGMCQGDSGGPFMQSQLNSQGDLYWTQIGVVSWGIGCGRINTYDFYTHVQKFRPWIDSTIQEALS